MGTPAEVLAQTRSGKDFSPWTAFRCPNDFDFETLLQESAAMQPDEENDDTATPHATAQPLAPTPKISAAPPRTFPTSATLERGAEDQGMQSPANQRRKRRRMAQKVAQGGHKTSPAVIKKYVKNAPQIAAPIDCEDLPTTAGAYTARNAKPTGAKVMHNKDELVSNGFTPLAWNGM